VPQAADGSPLLRRRRRCRCRLRSSRLRVEPAPPWAGCAQWRVLHAVPDPIADFLAPLQAWPPDPQRPRALHFGAVLASPPAASQVAGAGGAGLAPLAGQLAGRWQGLTPGFHRFAFEDAHVLLTLCVGEPQAMLREQAFRADAICLAELPLPALKALP